MEVHPLPQRIPCSHTILLFLSLPPSFKHQLTNINYNKLSLIVFNVFLIKNNYIHRVHTYEEDYFFSYFRIIFFPLFLILNFYYTNIS